MANSDRQPARDALGLIDRPIVRERLTSIVFAVLTVGRCNITTEYYTNMLMLLLVHVGTVHFFRGPTSGQLPLHDAPPFTAITGEQGWGGLPL